MKSSTNATVALDLDDLERELGLAAAPRKAVADDPLAELARIVGQEPGSSQTGKAAKPSAFDDFLASPPRPISGDLPLKTPPVEPLFPEFPMTGEARSVSAPDKAFDPLEALLAQDLGLRSGLDELPEPVMRNSEPVPSLDEMLAAELDAHEAAVVAEAAAKLPASEDMAEPVQSSLDPAGLAAGVTYDQVADAAPGMQSQPADETGGAGIAEVPDQPMASAPLPEIDLSELELALAPAAITPQPAPPITGPAAKFDDMVAEFEAAMRDVGAPPASVVPPSLEPITIPPPPEAAMVAPPLVTSPAPAPSSGLAPEMVATVGASAIAAGAVAATRPRRGLVLAGGAVAIAIMGLGGLALFGAGGSRAPSATGAAPVIAAKPGVTKERPANPGGMEVPNQDKEILQTRPQPQQAERIAPREEQPVDLAQAQRQAAQVAAPPATPNGQPAANGAGVRQIPGIAVVAPVTTTPPAAVASAPATAEPAPRPVASVPIVIAGQPPASATPPVATPPAVAPVAPVRTPAQAAAAPAPSAPAAAAAPAAPTAAATEPRRVRAVPIRPENGEAAPTRAQAQPRVVPAAPAPEPDLANAPLRITPQASRQASAQPRAVQPGTVPSSQPTLESEQPAAPTRTASTGGSFTVQLAAEGSEDAARAKFNRIRSQYGAVIGGEQANIRSAEVNGRSVYRVRVGSMSREDAVSMCERLKASGGSCFVARN